jgi:hypothetical protein
MYVFSLSREIKDGASTRPPGINVGPCGPAAKIIFTWGTFLNEVRMRKLRSSEGVHPMGWPLDVDGESTTCSGRRRVATNARRTREATSSRVTVPRVLPQIFWRG